MTIHAPKSLSDILTASLANPSKLVVVDFKAIWCGPCKAIHPFIKQLSETMPNVIFMEVDVEDEAHVDTVNQLGITAMPTFIYIKAGKVVDKTTGADRKKITDAINMHSAGN
jgi:thioredoxin 1